ncbi:hypothetical protein GCM10008986_34800 [Salinibacillus aidingensis]|uniref:Helicase ATP-binding domain-containing protein n=1 Tax=Salinibacillus aidingensis TaxID=237684 RepID=A0ABN1BSK3_9BACI
MELRLYNQIKEDIFGEVGIDTRQPDNQRLIEEYSKDLGLSNKIFKEIKQLVKHYNRLTKNDISLRYYQIMALYFTEKYFREYYNKKHFEKMLAYWMATGSGKTILMHINILQYLTKLKRFDKVQIILTTPGVNLIEQHKRELIPFINELNKEYNNKIDLVIETTGALLQKPKNYFYLSENSTTKRLILVDEGHIGLSASKEGKFKQLRNEMNSNESFLFEYSATYHNLNNDIQKDYENTIVYDYNYKLFYKDGYGKAYSFQEINPDVVVGEKDNLDATFNVFEEKLGLFNNFDQYSSTLFGSKFPDKPLLAFMGNTVNNVSDEGKNDEVSDISKVISYLANLSNDERKKYLNVFNNDIQGNLRLTRCNSVDDEILLSYGDGEFWGIINVGNGDQFFNDIEHPKVEKRNIQIIDSKYLFQNIDFVESPITVLIGSRKFAEGWNSFRVSVIGLINLGSSKGNKIIQIFGRGVRLKGIYNDGKRAFHDQEELDNSDDRYVVRKLETLNVFSLKKNYLETFIEDVSKEIEHTHTISIEVDPKVVKLGSGTKVEFSKYANRLPIFNLSKKDIDTKKVIIDNGKITYSYYDEFIEYIHELNRVKFSLDYRNNKDREEQDVVIDFREYLLNYNDFINKSEIQNLIDETSKDNELQLYSPNDNKFRKCNLNDILGLVAELRFNKKDIKFTIEAIEKIAFSVITDVINKLKNKINYNINSRNYTLKSSIEQQSSDKQSDGDIIYEYRVTKTFDSYEQKLEFINDLDNQKKQIKNNLEINSSYHIYEPLFKDDHGLTISPDFLNQGEVKFFRDINQYISTNFDGKDNYDFYLLRNVQSLKSIGIYLENDEGVYYPDFVLWVEDKEEDKIQIVFFDPKGQKGIINEDTLSENDKVNLGIKSLPENQLVKLEELLQNKYKKEIEVHSYIILRDSSDFGKEKSRSTRNEDSQWVYNNLVTKNILRLNWHKYDENGNRSMLFDGRSYLDIVFDDLGIK